VFSHLSVGGDDSMILHIATALATAIVIATSKPRFNIDYSFSAAVNGVFFCPRRGHLASLVWWHGKEIAPLPARVRRGGLVCYRNGSIEAGYWEWKGGKLLFNGKEIKPSQTLWALSGGGLWVLDGR
jgi:hypothetical protein